MRNKQSCKFTGFRDGGKSVDGFSNQRTKSTDFLFVIFSFYRSVDWKEILRNLFDGYWCKFFTVASDDDIYNANGLWNFALTLYLKEKKKRQRKHKMNGNVFFTWIVPYVLYVKHSKINNFFFQNNKLFLGFFFWTTVLWKKSLSMLQMWKKIFCYLLFCSFKKLFYQKQKKTDQKKTRKYHQHYH